MPLSTSALGAYQLEAKRIQWTRVRITSLPDPHLQPPASIQKNQIREVLQRNEFRSSLRGRHGGVEKRGGRKTSRMTPLPKRGFGPPLIREVFHPPQVSVLCFFLYKKSTTEQNRSSFGGSKNFREIALSGKFSSPHTFAPPYHGPNLPRRVCAAALGHQCISFGESMTASFIVLASPCKSLGNA